MSLVHCKKTGPLEYKYRVIFVLVLRVIRGSWIIKGCIIGKGTQTRSLRVSSKRKKIPERYRQNLIAEYSESLARYTKRTDIAPTLLNIK